MLDEEREKPDGQEAPSPPTEPAAPPPVPRFSISPFLPFLLLLGWGLFVVAVVVVTALGRQMHRLQMNQRALDTEVRMLRGAVMAARKVFLERAASELVYANAELELGNRHQASFRLGDEADRWLREVEPILSDTGRQKVAELRRALQRLADLAKQDTESARRELPKVRDDLERLIINETSVQ